MVSDRVKALVLESSRRYAADCRKRPIKVLTVARDRNGRVKVDNSKRTQYVVDTELSEAMQRREQEANEERIRRNEIELSRSHHPSSR